MLFIKRLSQFIRIIIIRMFPKYHLGFCGNNVFISRGSQMYFPENMYLYDNTNIYSGAKIICSRARFVMKKGSGAAQGFTVVTGGHMSLVGKWFKDISNEDKDRADINRSFDKDVIVEEDVWIAANVTLLSGVTVGRGASVGSGAVVRKNIPPYAIVIGNPAKIVGFRFSVEEILEHEKSLYSEKERLSKDFLESNYNKYFLSRIKEIKQYTKL